MKYILTLLLGIIVMSCQTQQATYGYQQVTYKAGGCFGPCPIFQISINQDKTATFEAERFNFSDEFSKEAFSKEKEGNFTGVLKSSDYKKLMDLINEIKPTSLENNYGERNISDLPTSFLTIKFTDGSTKIIEDYGKNGSPKLKEIYTFIEALRFNQQWKKVN